MSGLTGTDALTVDSVVSDVPGTRKSVVNHLVSLTVGTAVTTSEWSEVAFPFWSDGGAVDDNGYISLLKSHVISLKSVVCRMLEAVNNSGSLNEFPTMRGCCFRILEYRKVMDAWEVSNILLSNYGCVTDGHDCIFDHGGFSNYVV